MRDKDGREGGGGRREGVDAQEAHLYAFPLITGRGQWLPLHNGFASASHLLPASLGEEEVEEEEEWSGMNQKNCWLANQTWQCAHTCTHINVIQLWSSTTGLETNTYAIVRGQAGRRRLTQKE